MSDLDNQLTAAELDARLARLDQEIEPVDSLWGAIEAQLDDASSDSSGLVPNRPRRSSYEWAVAAAFAAATAAFIAFGVLDDSTGLEPNSERVAIVDAYAQHGGELIRVRQQLRSELRAALEELAPATRQVVVENLTRIEEARAEIERALEQEPGSRLLEQLLLKSYTNELTLLHEFTGVARTAQQRTQL